MDIKLNPQQAHPTAKACELDSWKGRNVTVESLNSTITGRLDEIGKYGVLIYSEFQLFIPWAQIKNMRIQF